ncbi:hypothetical protein fh0823_00800 [Francisella halioticida]|uniref:hypothetical protein n=1 Tax=Francisella halioticida TaxID=549298 RepID=UPI001AF080FC|nr:hypothetical protein [Francisella halioticida]BCD89941.1 hypothetical protein fh0823_00800 [Francisella halioticida]
MNYLKAIPALILVNLLIISTSYADGTIYTWKAKDGSTVFLQTAPIFEQEYEEVGVHFKNEVHEKYPAEKQLASLKQSNLYIQEQIDTASTNHNKSTNGALNVKIISPANGENRFIAFNSTRTNSYSRRF